MIKHKINRTESGFFGYEDDEYCSETPELRQAYRKDSGVTLPGKQCICLTFVPQQQAGGYGLINNTVGL